MSPLLPLTGTTLAGHRGAGRNHHRQSSQGHHGEAEDSRGYSSLLRQLDRSTQEDVEDIQKAQELVVAITVQSGANARDIQFVYKRTGVDS